MALSPLSAILRPRQKNVVDPTNGDPDEYPLLDPITGNLRRDTLEFVIRSLLTPNRRLQERVVQKYISSDMEFVHMLGSVKSRRLFYYIYRIAAQLAQHAEVVVKDTVIDANQRKAVAWVNIAVSPPRLSWLAKIWIPIIVFLQVKQDKDGRMKLSQQLDHHSIFYVYSLPGRWFFEVSMRVINPLIGLVIAAQGAGIDIVNRIRDQLKHPDATIPVAPSV